MKQLITLTVLLFSMFGIAKADEDKPIQVNELPKKAQEFIQKHFAKHNVSYAKVENDFWDKSYDVIFVNGDKIEFNKNGVCRLFLYSLLKPVYICNKQIIPHKLYSVCKLFGYCRKALPVVFAHRVLHRNYGIRST